MFLANVVCFCDIPVEDLELHAAKYGRFAVCFRKGFLSAKGANPVYYLARNSTIAVPLDVVVNPIPKHLKPSTRAEYFDQMVQNQNLSGIHHLQAAKSERNVSRMIAQDRANRFLAFHVYSFMKFFDESMPDDHPDNFYMEREWRVLGNVGFSLEDVSRIILPEEYAKRFRADIPEFYKQLTFI